MTRQTLRARARILRLAAALTAVCVAAGLVSGIDSPAAAQPSTQEQPFVQDDVLYANGDAGYACFRIPSVVRATNGDLLAFAEGRVADCGDDGDIDLVLRRSSDEGRTWTDIQVVSAGEGQTHGNPVPIVDQESGRVALVTTHNGADDCTDGCQRMPYLQTSDDNGRSWTPATLLSDATKPHWTFWYATGPMHGIQLQHGPNAGRMIVAASHEYLDEDDAHVYGTHLIFSDDGGLTWQIGAETSRDDGRVIAQETTVVQLNDGRVYALARERGTDPGSRAVATSSDGGATWDAPFRTVPEIEMPDVQGALTRFSSTLDGDDHDRLLFSAPLHPSSREVMAVRSSTDEGKSFNGWPDAKVFYWGQTAYSDLVPLDGTEAALLYEAGVENPYESIRYARFNEAFLDSPNDDPPNIPDPPVPGSTVADASRNSNPAFVRGGATSGEGRFGQALVMDGQDDHVEVPFDESIDLGADDFTMMTWIRYGAEKRSQVLFWAYRMGGGTTPQIWLRAEPQSNRIRAMMTVDRFNVSVQTTSGYDDQQWHHVVLQRKDEKLILSVDGAESVAVEAPPGSVTAGKQFGIHGLVVGRRVVDGADPFQGSFDEVRVYRRALSPAQITRIRETNTAVGGRLGLHLPLERIDPVASTG